MFCTETLQSFAQEIINRWTALSLLSLVMCKPACMWIHPYANGEPVQCSRLRKQKLFTNISEGIASVSLLCICEPWICWRPSIAMGKSHQQLLLLSMQGYGCSDPPLCDLVKVSRYLAGLGHERRPCCFQTPPLLQHTGVIAPWDLCARLQMTPTALWSVSAPICVIFLKETFMSALYGSQFPIRPFSWGV